jgi:hypothetical protein
MQSRQHACQPIIYGSIQKITSSPSIAPSVRSCSATGSLDGHGNFAANAFGLPRTTEAAFQFVD